MFISRMLLLRPMIELNGPYLIAETAYNHEGDFSYLKRMVDAIASTGADAVKFHMLLEPESYMQGGHPLIDTLRKWTFDREQWREIINQSNTKGLDIIVLCDDVESIEYIIESEMPASAIELHSTGLGDFHALNAVSKFDGWVILGIGGSTIDDIDYAVNLLRGWGQSRIILIYGFQSYPTDYRQINLSKMIKLRNLFELPVGYADHTSFDDRFNETISLMPAAMGFNILEKHFTLDEGKERIDYHASVGAERMKRIKDGMELAFLVHGNGELALSDAEMAAGNIGPLKKAIVARTDIRKGEKLTPENLWFKRTREEATIFQWQFPQLLGLEVLADIKADEIISFDKLKYNFKTSKLEEFTRVRRTGGD